MKLPTDLEVFQGIYNQYLDAYDKRSGTAGGNSPYLPIDVRATAASLRCNSDVLFGRLYYHLAHKYATTSDQGESIRVFQLKVGAERHCIHFPYLAAILAQLRDERRQRRINWSFTGGALIVSAAALAFSLMSKQDRAPTPSCQPAAVALPAPTAKPKT